MLARVDTLLQAGDIIGARRILEHAERSGVAAFKLAGPTIRGSSHAGRYVEFKGIGRIPRFV